MNTTLHSVRVAFIASFPQRSAARWFAARLVSECHYETTEARIAHVAETCGCTVEERETVIGIALDLGLVRSTMLATIQSGDFGHVPALIRCD